MRKIIFTLIALVATAAMAAEKTVAIKSGFSKIEVCAGAKVVYIADGSEGSAKLSGPAEGIEQMEVSLSKGTLFIGPKKDKFGRQGKKIKGVKVEVKGKGLAGIVVSSGASFKSTVPIASPGNTCTISVSSGADIEIESIRATSIKLHASSGGDIEIDNATATNITASASSGADIDIAGTTVNLTADASSGGSVDASNVKVRDKFKKDQSSGGSVKDPKTMKKL